MNAIKSVLSGNSSHLPEWLFSIVKNICEHPYESNEKEIAEIIHKEFGKESDINDSDIKPNEIKARGGRARGRKMKSKKMKSKKIKYPHKRTRRK